MAIDRNQLFAEHFPTTLGRDVAAFLFGDRIGGGQYREVFAHNHDAARVVKIETGYASFANVREWEAWLSVQGTKFEPWFAPVTHISACGTVLIQARTTPVTEAELPRRVPAFFTDLKPENWGRLDGRIVCHDYGNHLLHENGMTSRMRRANWSL